MTPQFKDLNPEQQNVIRELRAEVAKLDLQSDVEWAKYIKTGDQECYNTARALDSESEMKGLIAYLPKAGEGKISRIRSLIDTIKKQDDDVEACEGCEELPSFAEVRLDTLDGINEWREQYGIPPLDRLPKGMTGDAHDCVIARAFSSLDSLTIEGKVWKIIDVHIGGKDGYHLELYDPDRAMSQRLEIEGGASWDRFITNFDGLDYWDLVADEELIEQVEGKIESGSWPQAGLEEVFRRGRVSDLIATIGDRVKFEDGKFTMTDPYDDDAIACEYTVGTVSPMESAQYA